jgi:hypothetical protein
MDAKKSIDLLNKSVADELQAVHQYMYWHFDEFNKQLDNIKRFGPSHLALQSFNKGGAPAA